MHIIGRNAATVFRRLASDIIDTGEKISPRGLMTYELTDVTVEIKDPFDVLLYGTNRQGYHPAIGVVEGLLMIGGVSDPVLLASASKAFVGFTDGGALHGSYGPRLRNQLPRVIEKLRSDADTRQAVVTIWDPNYDLTNDPPPRDLPCTVYLLFRIRNGRLDLKVHMRSNDLWRGWCYDIIQFTMLQCTVANVLGLPVGRYVHHADSLHLYQEHVTAADHVTDRRDSEIVDRLFGIKGDASTGLDRDTWESTRTKALTMLYDPDYEPQTSTERWIVARLNAVRNRRTEEG